MPSESQQLEANLEQPWKEWYEELKSKIPQDGTGGSVVLANAGDSGNHGTTSLQQKLVNLAVPKKKMVTEVCW
jgi:hypothetical protein